MDNKKRFLINTAFIAVVTVLFYFALKYLAMWLLPFVIGFICALVLQKPIAYLSEKTKIPRGILSFILVGAILVGLLGLLILAGYTVYGQASQLVEGLTEQIPGIQASFEDISGRFTGWLTRLSPKLATSLSSTPAALLESVVGYLSNFVANLAKNAITGIPALILTTVISIVASCFITTDYYKITNFVLCQFSEPTQKLILKTKRVFMDNILKMLRGYTIIICITFFELFVGFLILDIPYTATIALLVAVVDILPVLGTGAVLIPWAIIDFCIGKTGTAIGLLVLYVAILVIRNIIEPKIIGKQVGLPAIVTLMSMYLGLNLFGIVGLFVMPVMIIVIAKLQEAQMIHIWKNGRCVSPTIVKGEEEMEHQKELRKQKRHKE